MSESTPIYAHAFVAAIIERTHQGRQQVLIQTRWKPAGDPIYSGTLEFVAGVLDAGFENVYDTLRREIKEEVGLDLKRVIDDSQLPARDVPGMGSAFGFRPFCCTQQLRGGMPWIGFIFRCEVEAGDPVGQLEEVRDPHWMDTADVKKLLETSPDKFFTLEIPAWDYYFKEVQTS